MNKIMVSLSLVALLSCTHDTDKLRRLRERFLRDASPDITYSDSGSDTKDGITDSISDSLYDGVSDSKDVQSELSLADVREDVPPEERCHNYRFNNPADLEQLVVENGVWDISEGYLRQHEGGLEGWRTAYFPDRAIINGSLTARIRMLPDAEPRVGVNNNHTGLLLRYDPLERTGYVIQFQRSNGQNVEIAVSDLQGNTLQSVPYDCGEIGCGYNNWRNLKAIVNENLISVYLNDSAIFSLRDNQYLTGYFGFACFAMGESHYDDVETCDGI